MAYDWTQLIAPGIGAGAQILGQKIATGANQAVSREQIAEQQRQFNANMALKQQEVARRNQMSAVAAPMALRALGYRDPQQIAQLQQQFAQQPKAPTLGMSTSGGGGGVMSPATQSSTAGKTLGAIGTGAMLASSIPSVSSAMGAGLGALGIGSAAVPFIGPAIAGAALGVSQIGKGRRTANPFVQQIENPFWDVFTKNTQGQATHEDVMAAYQQALQQAQQFASIDDTHAKVAKQGISNMQKGMQAMGLPV